MCMDGEVEARRRERSERQARRQAACIIHTHAPSPKWGFLNILYSNLTLNLRNDGHFFAITGKNKHLFCKNQKEFEIRLIIVYGNSKILV